MKFKLAYRDHKGSYGRDLKGWTVFAAEDEVQPGGDGFVTVLTDDYKAAVDLGMSGQEVYDLNSRMDCEDVPGWACDDDQDTIVKL